jgi:iron(III) transport system substrate-binding protein
VLYTASNDEIEKAVIGAFSAAHPDIKVSSVNMSTGPITQKAIAEMGSPKADVIWMVNQFALNQLKQAGALQPYAPKGLAVQQTFVDPDSFWYGHDATIMAMAVNKKVLADKHLPMPTDWADLIKPVYKGQISVASPVKSGTGYTIFTTMYDLFGWNYIDNLNANIFKYNESGSEAARQAVSGEVAIGLTYDQAILQQMHASPDIVMVTGRLSPNVIEGGGLLTGAPHEANGKLFMDWLFGKPGLDVLAPFVGISAMAGTGNVDLSTVTLWKLRHPIDQAAFKQEWAKRFEN